jgi:hypothetical protein
MTAAYNRRALSVALAIAKALAVPWKTTIWFPRMGENWVADDETVADATMVNEHIYQMVKQGKSMIIGGTIPLRPAPAPKQRSWTLMGNSGWLR